MDNITKIVANAGVLLKSPKPVLALRGEAETRLSCSRKQENFSFRQWRKVEEKRAILNLLLSDCKIEGKNLCFSIAKPFGKLLKTSKIEEWCATLSNHRTDYYEDFKQIYRKIELYNEILIK